MEKKEVAKTSRDKATMARRRLIIETAAVCFVEKGFHQTSVRDIASRAGISLGNLYNHFSDKAALIAEIALLETEDLAVIECLLDDLSDPESAIIAFCDAYFDYVSIPENVVLASEITAEAMRNPHIAKGFEANNTKLVALLSQAVSRADVGDLEADSKHLAGSIIDLIEASAMRASFLRKSKKLQNKSTMLAIIQKLIA